MPIWSGSGMRGGLCPMVVDLGNSFRKEGFTVGEIIYVAELLFVVRKPHLIYDILVLAEQRAKVVSLGGLWRIVEDSGYVE